MVDELREANRRLKLGRVGVSIRSRGERLYLRATLPPKLGSGKTQRFQQEIALNIYANPAGVKRAEAEARKVGGLLACKEFDWKPYLSARLQPGETVADWVERFEADYFARRDRNPKSETTWSKDYLVPFNQLQNDKLLNADLLIDTAKTYPPDTRARQRACTAYAALANFAGVAVDLKPLRGKYRPTAVKREDVPNNFLILEWCDRIPDLRWLNFFRLVACYGLRNHEAFYIDLERLKDDPVAVVRDGKTGYRAALPCPMAWWEQWFKGAEIELPVVAARVNGQYGNVSSQYFRRLGLPFKLYDLRHAQAGRMALKGIDPAVAAKSQGHSLQVHSDIYLNYLTADNLRGWLHKL